MSNVAIVLDLLPALKKLQHVETELRHFLDALAKLKNIKSKASLKGKWGIIDGGASVIDDKGREFWANYQQALTFLESLLSGVTESLFNSVVERTKKHTNRAAGSWAVSWNAESENSDIGFLSPEGANEITYYSGHRDWYPEAPTDDEGKKVLGVHDWALIQTRHIDMVNKVIHEFNFTRQFNKNDTADLPVGKTIMIYNSCPYIAGLINGSFSDNEINAGSVVALSLAEASTMLRSGVVTGK